MLRQIFINLPVNDIDISLQFYLEMGFVVNPLFTDQDQKCVMWSDAIYVMIQSKQFSNSYLNKPIENLSQFLSSSHTLPVDSVLMVDEMMEKGLKAGGKEPVPSLDEGFMYLRSIEDPDGFLWGIMHLNLEKFKALKGR